MGGYGSGQWERAGTHPLVEDHVRLDIRAVQRTTPLYAGEVIVVVPERCGSSARMPKMTLHVSAQAVEVTFTLNDMVHQQHVRLAATPGHFGRGRLWFLCPRTGGAACGRRVAVLYLDEPAQRFACRSCLGLAYETQRANPIRLAVLRIQALRRQLGAGPGALGCTLPPRPARMHWRTYTRLAKEYRQAELLLGLAVVEDHRPVQRYLKRRNIDQLVTLPAAPPLPGSDATSEGRAYLRQVARELRRGGHADGTA